MGINKDAFVFNQLFDVRATDFHSEVMQYIEWLDEYMQQRRIKIDNGESPWERYFLRSRR